MFFAALGASTLCVLVVVGVFALVKHFCFGYDSRTTMHSEEDMTSEKKPAAPSERMSPQLVRAVHVPLLPLKSCESAVGLSRNDQKIRVNSIIRPTQLYPVCRRRITLTCSALVR